MNISKSIEHHAEVFPEQTAIVFQGERISYSELNRFVNKTANGLKLLGVEKNDKVAIMLPNVPEFIYVFYACQKIGAVAVTVNTMYKGNEVRHILKDSGAKAIVCLTNFQSSINEILPNLPDLKHVITTGERTVNFVDPIGTFYFQAVLKKSDTDDLDGLYKIFGESVVETLKLCGVKNLWYSHRGGIRHKNGKKIAGVVIYEIEKLYIVNILIFKTLIDFDDFLSIVWVPPEVREKIVEPIMSIEECLSQRISDEELISNFNSVFEKRIGTSLVKGKMTREEHFAYEKQRSLARKKIKIENRKKTFLNRLISAFS